MTTDFKQFKIYAPPSQKKYALNDDGTLTITGVFSTTNKDLDGDIVSPQALASLQRQAVGLNLHLDHNHNYDGGIGVITESYLESNQVFITAIILSEHAPGILERLNLGMNFGFSIGGIPVVNNLNPQIIDDFVLLEISLTLLPANWDTFGTVEAKGVVKSKCLTGACHYIIKNSKNIMKKEYEDNSQELEQMVINLVNEAFANKEQVIIDEFRNELQPIVTEIVAEEVTPKVQEIVVNYLDELFPAEEEVAEEEIVEAEVDEEEIETSAVDENTEENPEEEEPVVEEKATDEEVIEEEVIEESTEEEIPADDEVFDEPIEIDIEKEEVIEETTEENPEEEEDDVVVKETAEETPEEEPVLDEKSIDLIVSRVFKKLNEKRETKAKEKKSKLNVYKKSTDKAKNQSFLNSDKRDRLGRNKKYL